MKRKNKIVFLTILFMLIGYASITITLILNGTINLTINDDYKIVFTQAIVDEVDESDIVIQENGTKLIFNPKELKNRGDKSVLKFIATNTSRNYDANIEIKCIGKEYTDFYKITSSFVDEIKAGTSESGRITVELIKAATEDIESEFTCEIETSAKEVENRQEDVGELYVEEILNGAEPVIKEELIPITLDEEGTVQYADIHTRWYSYEEKEWANAVILKENPSKTYKVDDIIKESDIESYFVWIPKYKYKLWNIDNYTIINGKPTETEAREIEIEFGLKDTVDKEGESCATPMTSGNIGECNNGEWMTHPAFLALDVRGFWMGKYETGYKGATSTKEAEVNNNDSSKIVVKPNVYSWRGNTVKNMFESSYNYVRALESHMMKNTEWGAVAYLSHSRYGINKEIRINNHVDYMSGYSSISNPSCVYNDTISRQCHLIGKTEKETQLYNTEIGYLASTTGNITGAYDMSGGAYEYMASYKDKAYSNSGFTSVSIENYDEKYFDVYNGNSTTATYQYGILGDATKEMGPFYLYTDEDQGKRYHNSWYNDYSGFIVSSSYPWFYRGGTRSSGILAGQYYCYSWNGDAVNQGGFRLVLAPE